MLTRFFNNRYKKVKLSSDTVQYPGTEEDMLHFIPWTFCTKLYCTLFLWHL